MMSRVRVTRVLVTALMAIPGAVAAEPYFAVFEGLPCSACHVAAGGGGMRTAYGTAYARTGLAAGGVQQGQSAWTGAMTDYLRVGANLRVAARETRVSGTDSSAGFGVDRATAYVLATPLPGRLVLYVDQQVAPGSSRNREAWIRFRVNEELSVRAGQLFLPYGLRLEDDTAFVRQVPGINFNTPDSGVELSYETGVWLAQLALTNGTAGAAESDDGKQASALVARQGSRWRLGGSLSRNNAEAGDRRAYAGFVGVRTGPVAWLAETGYVEDDGLPGGERRAIVSLLEGNWRFRQGQNLKISYEYFDPDDDLDEDERTRVSAVWEYVPMPFLQLRVGVRAYDGIPQSPLQNRDEYFVQLHGFL